MNRQNFTFSSPSLAFKSHPTPFVRRNFSVFPLVYKAVYLRKHLHRSKIPLIDFLAQPSRFQHRAHLLRQTLLFSKIPTFAPHSLPRQRFSVLRFRFHSHKKPRLLRLSKIAYGYQSSFHVRQLVQHTLHGILQPFQFFFPYNFFRQIRHRFLRRCHALIRQYRLIFYMLRVILPHRLQQRVCV